MLLEKKFLSRLMALQEYAQTQIKLHYNDELNITPWKSDLGHGWTGVCEGSNLERAAVSVSSITGSSLPSSANPLRKNFEGNPFQVEGLSVIFHPYNPWIPTAHANIRKFSVQSQTGQTVSWYGGGVDLTPYFVSKDDCDDWHRSLKNLVERFDPSIYWKWRKDCDDYFYLKYRKEPRGVGGIFFDDYLPNQGSAMIESFLEDMMIWFFDRHTMLAKKYSQTSFTSRQKDFQLWRRGRYVEFNLLQDRGTLFGLQTGGRIESILMSLPPVVSWKYAAEENLFSVESQNLLKMLSFYKDEADCKLTHSITY